MTLSAYLTDYPEVKSEAPEVTTTIEIIDQCSSLNSIDAPKQTNPVDYYYTGS